MTRSNRIAIIVATAVSAFISGGCVSSGTYQAMERQSLQAGRNLDEAKAANAGLDERNRKLALETETLGLKLKNLETELAVSRKENEQLKLEMDKLSQSVKPENLLQTLASSFAALQAENARLKREIAVAGQPSKKEPAPPVTLTPILNRPMVPGGEPKQSDVAPQMDTK